jgi:hypothetical protein
MSINRNTTDALLRTSPDVPEPLSRILRELDVPALKRATAVRHADQHTNNTNPRTGQHYDAHVDS